jgi:rhodanese-related sulfurtransferase
MNDIRTIDREELKAKLDGGDDFILIMTHSHAAFEQAHIPGSIHFHPLEQTVADLPQDKNAEIVVYCTDVACVASQMTYHGMVAEGFTNVRRYAGGLADWDEAGYELASGAADSH